MKQFILFSFSAFLLFTTSISFAQNALHFDRTSDYVQTTFPGVAGRTNRTFEAWIFVDVGAAASNLCIMDYGVNAVGSRNTFAVGGSRSLTFISGGTNANISSPANVITEGVWTHVAFVLNSGVGYLYVNGTQVGTGSLSTVNTPSGLDLRIGERVPGGSILFEGIIDEVRVWNTARTVQEIRLDTNKEFCSIPSGLVAYYKFNQGIAGGSNTGLDTLVEHVSSNNGTLNSFSLSGNTSNWISGKTLVSSVSTNDTVAACNSSLSPSGKYTWTTSGTYYDTLTTSYGCDSTLQIELTITNVNPLVNVNGNTITSGQSGATYQWLDCDSNYMPISGETSQSLNVSSSGNYAVRVEVNGCVDTSSCVEVIISTVGINNVSPTSLKIYPNPSKGDIFINGLETTGTLSILDSKGVVVYKTIMERNSNNSVSLPASLGNGMYLVHFQNDEVLIRKKLLILRE